MRASLQSRPVAGSTVLNWASQSGCVRNSAFHHCVTVGRIRWGGSGSAAAGDEGNQEEHWCPLHRCRADRPPICAHTGAATNTNHPAKKPNQPTRAATIRATTITRFTPTRIFASGRDARQARRDMVATIQSHHRDPGVPDQTPNEATQNPMASRSHTIPTRRIPTSTDPDRTVVLYGASSDAIRRHRTGNPTTCASPWAMRKTEQDPHGAPYHTESRRSKLRSSN